MADDYVTDFGLPYSGLISRGEIFVDWIVKTICGYIFEGKHHFTR